MVLNGGYVFEDGNGGLQGGTFAQSLDEPMVRTFLPSDTKLKNLIIQRRQVRDYQQAAAADESICQRLKSL